MPFGPAEVFARVAFYPTLLYTYFMSRVSSREWYSRIDSWVVVGALPVRTVAKELVEVEKVKGVVSLTQDFEDRDLCPSEDEWREMGVEVLKLSTLDFTGTPSQRNIHTAVEFIMDHRDRNQSVYVHCKAGRTRSVTVVACYLVEAYGMSPENALDFIRIIRPHIWLRDKQLKSVYKYFDGVSVSMSSSFHSFSSENSNKSSEV